MDITKDCIIGYELKPENIKSLTDMTVGYFNKSLGNVRVTLPAYQALMKGDFDRFIFAGILRNAFANEEEPPLIDSAFINGGYKSFNYPKTFKEKTYHLLKYLYDHGGNENGKFELNSTIDYSITYSNPQSDEFVRIVQQLEKRNMVTIGKSESLMRGKMRIFWNVELTTEGMEEIEKSLPTVPLIGLVEQKITTGDVTTDEKINHAKNLFFKERATLAEKRSACETLSHILEPLREDLKIFFSKNDVSDFFHIVNKFDIRHNKQETTKLIHEEQLEWVFYTLLNTINTYIKLKNKSNP